MAMDLRDEFASLSTSPRKILKIVIALSVVLLLIWLFMLLKMDSQPNKKVELPSSEQTEQQGIIDSTSTIFSGKQQGLTTRSAEGEEESSLFGNAFITFMVLILLLAGVWYWSDKGQVSTTNNYRRVLDSEVMGDGATLQIVEINNEVWVLGVTTGSIDLLHRYNEDEWKEEAPTESQKEGNFLRMFKDGLS